MDHAAFVGRGGGKLQISRGPREKYPLNGGSGVGFSPGDGNFFIETAAEKQNRRPIARPPICCRAIRP